MNSGWDGSVFISWKKVGVMLNSAPDWSMITGDAASMPLSLLGVLGGGAFGGLRPAAEHTAPFKAFKQVNRKKLNPLKAFEGIIKGKLKWVGEIQIFVTVTTD